jgi:hypothetical protein
MTVQCREGHESTEDDYCSVCGAAIARPSATPKRAAAGGVMPKKAIAQDASRLVCPSCGERRTDDARFCEVCRYDFVTGTGGPPPAAFAATPEGEAPAVQRGSAGALAGVAWEFVVTVDPSLDTEPDPATPCPVGAAEQIFAVDTSEMLVGRRDDRRDIRPEIPLSDPGTSRRHAKFVKNLDGSVSVQDLASMNGTRWNGTDMVAGSRQVLAEGDEVTLGRWTRIRLRRKT